MQTEWWVPVAVGLLGWASGLWMGGRKQDLDENSETFNQAEKLNSMLQQMVETLRNEVNQIKPRLAELEKQQNQNILKINTLETKEASCQEKVAHVMKNNEMLMDMLKDFHNERRVNSPDGPIS